MATTFIFSTFASSGDFQRKSWFSSAASMDNANDKSLALIKEELADVLNYALLIANKYNFDVAQIILDKIEKNALNRLVITS